MHPHEMSKIILESTVKYLTKHKKSTLRTIDLVIFQPEMVKDFVNSMSNAVEKQESWWKIAVDWITDRFIFDSTGELIKLIIVDALFCKASTEILCTR